MNICLANEVVPIKGPGTAQQVTMDIVTVWKRVVGKAYGRVCGGLKSDGKMAQSFRELAVLIANPGSVYSTHVMAYNHL